VKLIVEPLVPWIWFGGLVIVMGAIIGMFHGPRSRTKPSRESVSAPAGVLEHREVEEEPVAVP
jgi:cytochrome c biogenesis factor